MTRPGRKIPAQAGIAPGSAALEADALTTKPTMRRGRKKKKAANVERERDRERERERDRQTDRQTETDRQTDRQTDTRQRGRRTERAKG